MMLLLAGLLVAGVVVTLVWLGFAYNRLTRLRNRFRNAYAQIDVQLKRRYDLIPQLVETARGYMRHESSALEAVTTARAAAVEGSTAAALLPGDPQAMKALFGSESGLLQALGRFTGLVESYPDLKADTLMKQLMEDLKSSENRVAFARQAFNDFVMAYNSACAVFPANLVAGVFKFTPAEFFRLENAAERELPKVQLS